MSAVREGREAWCLAGRFEKVVDVPRTTIRKMQDESVDLGREWTVEVRLGRTRGLRREDL